MAAAVYKRARAERDLVEDYVYLAEQAGIETAERFLSNAEKSFSALARRPGITELFPLLVPLFQVALFAPSPKAAKGVWPSGENHRSLP